MEYIIFTVGNDSHQVMKDVCTFCEKIGREKIQNINTIHSYSEAPQVIVWYWVE